MGWNFYTEDGIMKVQSESVSVGDADTLDGFDSTAFIQRAGDTMTGDLFLSGPPVAANEAATMAYVDSEAASEAAAAAALKVDLGGDTMTGNLVMSGAGVKITLPNAPLISTDATNKTYVDSTFVNVTGDTISGDLILTGTASISIDDPGIIEWSDAEIFRAGAGVLQLGAGNQLRVDIDPVDPDDVTRKSYVDSLTGGSTSLDDLTDVATAGVLDTYLLAYDGSVDNRWEPVAPYWVETTGDTMTGSLLFSGSLSTDLTIATEVSGDTDSRFEVAASGKLTWGSGSAVADIGLARTAANILSLDSGDYIRVLQDPSDDNDLARKFYVDSLVGASSTLAGLNDVTITAPADGQILRYESSIPEWQNTSLILVNDAGQLQVPTTGASAGVLLGGDSNLYRSAANTLKTDDSFIVAVKTTMLGASSFATRTESANYTVNLTTDHTILTDSSGAVFTVTLPSSHTLGDEVVIKDSTGSSGAFPVTIATNDSDTIDGSASDYVMSVNYESVTLRSNGTNWFLI